MADGDPVSTPANPDLAVCTVVFGRSTFLGRSLVSGLLNSGRWAVRVADTLPPPTPAAIHPRQADYFQFDVTDLSGLHSAVSGAVSVFLVDPLPPFPSPAAIVDVPRLHALSVNVAKNLVSAGRKSGVRRLVYSGSADVIFDGVNDFRYAYESVPYPDKYYDAVNELRMQVEIVVLRSNGKDGLRTCTLRPSIIFGPGDVNVESLTGDGNFVSFLLEEVRCGRAKFVLGNGKNICDITYVENVVHANISAERALSSGLSVVAGKPFFISNDEPMELWQFISNILVNLGFERPRLNFPIRLAMSVLLLFEKVGKNKLNDYTSSNLVLSPSTFHFLSCSRTSDCSKAEALFGYSPIVSYQEGIKLTLRSHQQLAKNLISHSKEQDSTVASKADQVLGSGVVADILLWRDEKKTFASMVVSFVIFYWLFLSGKTFVSSSAKIVMVVYLALLIQRFLPSTMFGSNIVRMPSSSFEISESTARRIFFALASLWNEGISTLKSLARGDDWCIFFKATGYLYLIKFLLYLPVSLLVGLGWTCLFTVFIVYEQYEEEVGQVKEVAVIGIESLKESLVASVPKFLTHNAQASGSEYDEGSLVIYPKKIEISHLRQSALPCLFTDVEAVIN